MGSRGQASAAQDPRRSASLNIRVQGPGSRGSGTGPEPRAWSCPAPRGGACAPRPAPAASSRPVSATAARRARHVAGAARPPGSRLKRGAGREDRRGPTDAPSVAPCGRRSEGRPGDPTGRARRGMGVPGVSVHRPGWASRPGLGDSGGRGSSLATAAEPSRGP